MKESILQKRQKFSKQIRRNKISSFMAECRSKLVDSWIENLENAASNALARIFPVQLSDFDKTKLLLEMTVGKETLSMKEEADYKPVNAVMASKSGDCFQLGEFNNIIVEISEHEMVECLNYLSRLISTKNEKTSKIMREINRANSFYQGNASKLEAHMVQLYKYTDELKQITSYCNIFLQQCLQTLNGEQSSLINPRVVLAVTSCLIELSCFRPRKYRNEHNIQIIEAMNQSMKEFRDLINFSTAQLLQAMTGQIEYKLPNIKVFINVIYIFGNIFVSLSSDDSEGKGLFSDLHNLVFVIFDKLFKLFNHQQELKINGERMKEFQELSSLMVWFIRNEIMIGNGLYKPNQTNCSLYSEPNQTLFDSKWIEAIFQILLQFNQSAASQASKTTRQAATATICEIISLLKLMQNDFNLKIEYIWHAFKLIYSFGNKLEYSDSNQKTIKLKIYQFYIEFLNVKYVDSSEFNLYECIGNQVVSIVQNEEVTEIGLKLCQKVIKSYGLLENQQKMRLFQEICNNQERFLKSVQRVDEYQSTLQYLKLIHCIMELQQGLVQRNEMQFQILGYATIKGLLQLSNQIWENQKTPDDIISTLLLLRSISDNQSYSNQIKQAIVNQDTTSALQNLSAHTNQDINQLVYEIYQLLEIE